MKHATTLLIWLIFSFCILNAQNRKGDTIFRTYIPIKQYRDAGFGPLTKKDSLNFRYVKKDTLVLMPNKPRPNGRMVPYKYKDSTFLNIYAQTAFGLRNDSTDNKRTTLYWKKPLNIFFAKNIEKDVKKDFKNFVDDVLAQIDSLSVNYVNKVEASNYVIYTSEDYDYESKINKKDKSVYYMHWKNGEIDKLAMRINSEVYFSKKLQLMEMKRFFVQSLGYFRMLKELPCESYFSSCHSQEKRLTELDIEFLRYHYGYGICKGINYENFQTLHKNLKKKLKSGPNSKVYLFYPY
ncbi:hypothetical protein [Winogradskyella ursingii]|uniref:hypothetical protein n=1 Tax=Winogradskyella ursingii TaxID=2686079 RepID=UPI0015CC2F69|nr:hypothetical protein [Winogradskyella ursingii]